MGNGAYIKDTASLKNLRIAIGRYCEESENQLRAVDSKLESRLTNLKYREAELQREVEYAEDDLRDAKRTLSRCEANTYEDENGNTEHPDCSFERENVIECRERLRRATHNYDVFKREIRKLEGAIEEYKRRKFKYKKVIQFEKEAATSSLRQLIDGAEDYRSVSSPISENNSTGMSLAKAAARVDPTMILASAAGVVDIIVMSAFYFLSLGDSLFKVSNSKKNGIITTTYKENEKEYICSELKIETKDSAKYGKIVRVNIPPILRDKKIGKHLIQNMEANCRANDCYEIYGWANKTNISFYKELGYKTRNQTKESGGEVYKPLNSNFSAIQEKAKDEFEELTPSSFLGGNDKGEQTINPLKVIPPEEINDEGFWEHHKNNKASYIELIENYDKCQKELKNGKSIDDLKREDKELADAYNIFHHSHQIQLYKSGDYYKVNSDGRHRIAATHAHYLRTGKVVNLPANIYEKNDSK